jgi:glucose-6-phosphate-specific signal transduction histidine kinase
VPAERSAPPTPSSSTSTSTPPALRLIATWTTLARAYLTTLVSASATTKYAEATRAAVRVRETERALIVVVEDDGVGGADPSGGTGLSGLLDRVAAFDGRLEIDSPLGGGTRVRAELPFY